MKLAKSVIVIATPKIFPTFLESARMPLATPSSGFGTFDKIALLDGDWNKPFPIPINPETSMIKRVEVSSLKVMNIKSDNI